MRYQKIYILGHPGSGKTLLAEKISKILKIKNFDLDDIKYREDRYKPISRKKRDAKLKKILKNSRWIIEGSYASPWVRPATKKSTLIIILKSPFLITIKRLFIRYIKRKLAIDKTKKGAGNLKDFLKLIKYAYTYEQGYFIRHKNLAKRDKKPYIILKNNKEINKFLKLLEK